MFRQLLPSLSWNMEIWTICHYFITFYPIGHQFWLLRTAFLQCCPYQSTRPYSHQISELASVPINHACLSREWVKEKIKRILMKQFPSSDSPVCPKGQTENSLASKQLWIHIFSKWRSPFSGEELRTGLSVELCPSMCSSLSHISLPTFFLT